MDRNGWQFGQLFTKFRLKAEFPTLAEFGRELAAEGLLYEDSIFSRWQRGNRIPKERKVLITILKVFIKRRGIQDISEANFLLKSARQNDLTNAEEKELFEKYHKFDYNTSAHSINNIFMPEKHFDSLLSTITNSSEQLPHLEQQVNLLYVLIEEGYPSIAYERFNKILKLIRLLELDSMQAGRDLIGKINWMRLESLSEVAGKPEEFDKAIKEAETAILYAKEYSKQNLGELYWLHSSLERKHNLMQSKLQISKDRMIQGLSESQLAVSFIENNEKKTSALFEIIYFALFLKDKDLYDRTIFELFSLIEGLSSGLCVNFKKAYAWDAKARGDIRFGLHVETALDNLKTARSYSQSQYQTVNINLQATEFQALDLSQDPEHHKYAKKLRETLVIENAILDNPYQQMRFEKKELLGL